MIAIMLIANTPSTPALDISSVVGSLFNGTLDAPHHNNNNSCKPPKKKKLKSKSTECDELNLKERTTMEPIANPMEKLHPVESDEEEIEVDDQENKEPSLKRKISAILEQNLQNGSMSPEPRKSPKSSSPISATPTSQASYYQHPYFASQAMMGSYGPGGFNLASSQGHHFPASQFTMSASPNGVSRGSPTGLKGHNSTSARTNFSIDAIIGGRANSETRPSPQPGSTAPDGATSQQQQKGNKKCICRLSTTTNPPFPTRRHPQPDRIIAFFDAGRIQPWQPRRSQCNGPSLSAVPWLRGVAQPTPPVGFL